MIVLWLVLATVIGIVIGWVLGSKGALSDRIVAGSPPQPSESKGPSLDTLMAEIAGLKAQVIVGSPGIEQVKADQLGTYQAEMSPLRGRVHELESQQLESDEPESDLQTDLLELPGLSTKDQAKLINRAGIQSQSQLFEQAKSAATRTILSTKTGLDDWKLIGWANLMDYQRLRDLTINQAYYLRAAGAASLSELARKRSHLFYPQLKEGMERSGHLAECPTEQTLGAWIEEAKTLPRIVR